MKVLVACNEKRLIDANTLISYMDECSKESRFRVYYGYAKSFIDDAPTVDAVEVVRCRDCKHWKPSGSKAGNSFSDMEYIGGCEFTNYCRRESDFCSYGERNDGDWNG